MVFMHFLFLILWTCFIELYRDCFSELYLLIVLVNCIEIPGSVEAKVSIKTV